MTTPANPAIADLLSEAATAIDVLADDAVEAGYQTRAERATELAMRLRKAAITLQPKQKKNSRDQ